MKLRNIGTGEIKEAEARDDGIYLYSVEAEQWFKYDLPLLAEYWEYYIEPTEPLIKDEKIRKAVRAWAEANDIDRASYYKCSHYWYLRAFNDHEQAIDFWLGCNTDPEIIESKSYTIAELCGEEE